MTPAELHPCFPKYRNKGLLVDTNLLLMYLVGELEPELIPRFKRTSGFNTNDYFRLKTIIDFFPTIVTIPGVLTEVSNLAGHFDGRRREQFFSRFAERIGLLKEEHVPSRDAAKAPAFSRLGLTDSAIIHACRDKYLAITADLNLVLYMEKYDLDVVNFNHLRFLNWN